ncbi:type VI secretion system-associated protein TagF [Niveibacterium sp. 24ML]|uniref:type VI secretion system-associated protein TagF n=1 Tax=Niveibacterium sp. 24ML TaxID=2985512 RepID=UPI0022702546|nr:type VI secretion system-associated protein TagF [Niveibacterium sp. 24ML]MCX9156597.1 type VI secretion system-associated protein TagF [Niveibacterium sp. 24ML]
MHGAGWYGKLPAIGDFAHRRLDADFVARWDAWLQTCLAESQRALGGAWLDRYLTAPVWRFALSPGVVGGRAWVGLLLPSVDRVGRYFPLTVCAPLDGSPLDGSSITGLTPWYDKAEAAARACLAHDATLHGFEESLLAAGLPQLSSQGQGGAIARALQQHASPLPLACRDGVPDLAAVAGDLLVNALSAYSVWWQASGAAFLCLGLPAPSRYTEMIDQAFAR